MADGWIDITPETDLPWSDLEPGPALAQVIAATDPDDLPGSARVSFLAACDRLNSWVQAQTVRAITSVSIATVHEWSNGENDEHVRDLIRRVDTLTVAEQIELSDACTLPPASWIADEIAAALHIASGTATRRVRTASMLMHHYTRLWDALEAGHITWSQCLAMLEVIDSWNTDPAEGESVECDLEQLAEAVFDVLLPIAHRYPPARLRERTRHALTRLAPEIAAARRAHATRKRTGISVWNAGDGLATLALTGPAVDVHALATRIRAEADTAKATDEAQREADPDGVDSDELSVNAFARCLRGWDEPRTIGQWRLAAVLGAFGLAPIALPPATTDATTPDGARAIPGLDIRIVIDLPTALGLADNPGDLPGYGPLDPEFARALACSGDWKRWITDPITGHLLDDGDRRLPTARLARFIKARDARCDAPSCSHTTRLDIDHTPTYATTRQTSAHTLTLACARHNRSRHKAKWDTPEHRLWVSPLGRHYATIEHQPLPTIEVVAPRPDPSPF